MNARGAGCVDPGVTLEDDDELAALVRRTAAAAAFIRASLDATAAWFRGGEAELEVGRTYRVADMAVIAAIERQRGVVGGLPEQDRSLRVTLVFRRRDGQGCLVHRHAAALVRPVGHARLSVLARGAA